MPPHQVHIWHLDLNVSDTALAALMTTLGEDERQQARRFHRRQDAERFVARRGLVRATLGRYLDCPPETLHFATGPYGKPHLLTAPPSDVLHFNYSHSGKQLLLAASSDSELGIDLEGRAWSEDFRDIARLYFSAQEKKILANANNPTELFFRCWTAKEAVVKALGQGLSRPLHDFTVFTAQGTLRAVLHAEDGFDEPIQLYALSAPNGHQATLAIIGPDGAIETAVVHRWTCCTLPNATEAVVLISPVAGANWGTCHSKYLQYEF